MDATHIATAAVRQQDGKPYGNPASAAVAASGCRIVVAGRRKPRTTSLAMYYRCKVPGVGSGFLWFDSVQEQSYCFENDLPTFYVSLYRHLLESIPENNEMAGSEDRNLHPGGMATSGDSQTVAELCGFSVFWMGNFQDLEHGQGAFPIAVRRAYRMARLYSRTKLPLDAPISDREIAGFMRFLRVFRPTGDVL